MRKTPSDKTLKKLFSLSGNLCAFPNCEDNLVDKNGNLIGQICHIEAAEEGGERYNPNQTDDERSSFENLLILCANHHIVTNDVTKYPVKAMKKMKSDHENKFIKSKYRVIDKTINEAKKQFFNTQIAVQFGSGDQINAQGNQVVVNKGVSVSDVVALFKELFKANFPKLQQIAKISAEENVRKFSDEFYKNAANKLNQSDLHKFSNPDVQYVLNEAIQANARQDSDTLRKILSNLVIQRVKNDNVELKQKVLNEAISTVNKLTTDQLKILTLCFIIKNTRITGVMSWENFKNALERDIKPFIDFRGTDAEILYLQYAGCGSLEQLLSFNLFSHFKNNYSHQFTKGINKEDYNAFNLPSGIKQSLILNETEDKVFLNIDNISVLEEKLKDNKILDDLAKNVVAIYKSSLLPDKEVQDKMEKEIPWISQVAKIFKETQMGHLRLTSVGMAIAIAYYEQVVSNPLNFDVWIN